MDFKEMMNTPDEAAQYDSTDISTNRVWGGLAYILFFIPLIACPDSQWGKFHANQSLILLIFSLLIGIVCVPIGKLGFIGAIICWVLRALPTVGTIFGLVTAFQNKAQKLPFIGDLVTIIK